MLENKCDLINMSYGEATATPNAGVCVVGGCMGFSPTPHPPNPDDLRTLPDLQAGRFIQLAEELVHKHNVIYVSSAGELAPGCQLSWHPAGSGGRLVVVGCQLSWHCHQLLLPGCGGWPALKLP